MCSKNRAQVNATVSNKSVKRKSREMGGDSGMSKYIIITVIVQTQRYYHFSIPKIIRVALHCITDIIKTLNKINF